ncbi:putrescine aminotransferase [Salinimicrobium marinum]|uniref:Putrescine aminotransferase n=1 Tax=Salinimicrobium marinum TaxID=680283 RepID=A0A918SJ17_9FLAO|nr:aspartate aminotransferase family protein [Salinimicrobium marinum]GHA41766.1 putrescine aminotransferase [Salinimicrobium marinum]
MTVKEKDDKYFGRGGPALNLEVEKAKGSLIFDPSGKKYIDFLGGAGVGNLGWGLEEVEMAIRNSERPSYVYPHFYYKPWAELAEQLAAITPEHLTTSFRATGGSEAVDAALQMAMMYTGRKKILSIEGSYHGNTFGALSVASSSNGKKFHNLLSGCEKIKPPLEKNALQEIEEKLKGNEYAAFIMEPVIVNLGVVIPEKDYMEKLDRLCKEHGTLLIMDEAITGFFRTGKFFASEHYNIKPDIMCLAKAISSGYAGMGAVMTTDKVAKAVEGKVGLYSSYGWHPVGTDAAIATINYMLNNTEELLDNMESISQLFKDELPKLRFREEPEIRIKGLAIAVDVGDEDYASEIKKKAVEHGLLMNTEGSSLSFLPALNIDSKTVLEGIKILKEVVE